MPVVVQYIVGKYSDMHIKGKKLISQINILLVIDGMELVTVNLLK